MGPKPALPKTSIFHFLCKETMKIHENHGMHEECGVEQRFVSGQHVVP